MRLTPVFVACVAALTASCVGQGDEGQADTAVHSGAVSAAYRLACVDLNHNWQCDDADTSKVVTGSGDTGFNVAAGDYVLLESRSEQQQRTLLLLSRPGSAVVDAHSTLASLLGESASAVWQDIPAATLEAGFAAAMAQGRPALQALQAYAAALKANPQAPVLEAYAPTLGDWQALGQWAGEEDDARVLKSWQSTLVGNNESNRVFWLDEAAAAPLLQELDLLPGWDLAEQSWGERLADLADNVLGLVVDTVSAASGGTSTPVDGEVDLAPGFGVNALQPIRGGQELLVLLNTGVNRYQDKTCAEYGSEGIYRVSLALAASTGTANLYGTPGCVHSGFSLMAADELGRHVVAWDSTQQQLWLLDGENLQPTAQLAIGIAAPQAMTVSPGGQFAAVAGNGVLAIIDLEAGKVLSVHTGPWGAVSAVQFAGGVRQLVLAAGNTLHVLQLDNALQPIMRRQQVEADAIEAMSVAADGDSVAVVAGDSVYWRHLGGFQLLTQKSLPAHQSTRALAMTRQGLLWLGFDPASRQFGLYRLTLPVTQPGTSS